MKPANPRILTINGGSSNIKFALFEAGDSLGRILQGLISANASRVAVRIIHTDEEWMIAKTVCRVLRLGISSEKVLVSPQWIEHKPYIDQHGQDMPEIRNWKWRNPK